MMDFITSLLMGFAFLQAVRLAFPTITVVLVEDEEHWVMRLLPKPKGNAYNNILVFIPVIVIYQNCKHPKAVLAQELYELEQRRWLWNDVLHRLKGSWSRKLEATGHEIEVQEAVLNYAADPEKKRAEEAWALTGYEQFHGWDISAIRDMMSWSSVKASKWISDNRRYIVKMQNRL